MWLPNNIERGLPGKIEFGMGMTSKCRTCAARQYRTWLPGNMQAGLSHNILVEFVLPGNIHLTTAIVQRHLKLYRQLKL